MLLNVNKYLGLFINLYHLQRETSIWQAFSGKTTDVTLVKRYLVQRFLSTASSSSKKLLYCCAGNRFGACLPRIIYPI